MPRNFAIRLTCSYGDFDSWVTLANREESVEQIRELSWEFKCREHGAQLGLPKEVIEIAPLEDLRPPAKEPPPVVSAAPAVPEKKAPRCSEREFIRVPVVVYGWTSKCGTFHEEAETITVNNGGTQMQLKTKLELGDSVFLIHKSGRDEQKVRVASLETSSASEMKVGLAFEQPLTDFWKRTRKKPRISKTLRVAVKGGDSKGNYFIQSAYTVDVSQDGARLDGVGFLTTPGQTIEVRRLWRKAKFRVVWIGQIGTAESNQIGVVGLQPDKDIWHVRLPGDDAAQPAKKSMAPKE
jgi:hypothetical protein